MGPGMGGRVDHLHIQELFTREVLPAPVELTGEAVRSLLMAGLLEPVRGQLARILLHKHA